MMNLSPIRQISISNYQTVPEKKISIPVQYYQKVSITPIITTEKIEVQPDQFISKLTYDLNMLRSQNQQLEKQLQTGNPEYWKKMFHKKEEEINQLKEYYSQKFQQISKQSDQLTISRGKNLFNNLSSDTNHDAANFSDILLNLKKQIEQNYQLANKIQSESQNNIAELQRKQRTQIEQLMEQIKENNRLIIQIKEQEKNKPENEELNLLNEAVQQKSQENDELRKQLQQLHLEFKQINVLLNELIEENNSLQKAYSQKNSDPRISELENLIKAATEENLQKTNQINQLKEILANSNNPQLLEDKKLELEKLQQECQQIKQMSTTKNGPNNLDLKLKYEELQKQISQLQQDIIDLYDEDN